MIYPEIQNNPYSIYSFLLVAGYLKVAAVYPQNDGNFMCDIAIPNKEIAFVYEKEVLNRTNQNNVASTMLWMVWMSTSTPGKTLDDQASLVVLKREKRKVH